MSLFAIADTHLSFSAREKTMEIFPGWGNYEARLAENWRALVREEDTVVIAGDVSWAMHLPDTLADFRFLHALPGTKILLKGNHDYWWETMRKLENFLAENSLHSLKILFNNAYRAGDFAVCGSRGWFYDDSEDADKKVLLREAGRLRTSIEAAQALGGEPVAFLHYPPATRIKECPEMMQVLRETGMRRCYYGHLHAQSAAIALRGSYEGIAFHCVSADQLGFSPIRVDSLP